MEVFLALLSYVAEACCFALFDVNQRFKQDICANTRQRGIKWECDHFNGRPKALCSPFNIDSHRFRDKTLIFRGVSMSNGWGSNRGGVVRVHLLGRIMTDGGNQDGLRRHCLMLLVLFVREIHIETLYGLQNSLR